MRRFNREQYKKIKKFDRQQMEDFLTNVCQESYERGVTDMVKEYQSRIANMIGFDEVIGALRAGKCKGIGKSTVDKLEGFIKQMEAESNGVKI
ncbi:MAG: hypothetical protein ACI3ZR_06895 [bacterium]